MRDFGYIITPTEIFILYQHKPRDQIRSIVNEMKLLRLGAHKNNVFKDLSFDLCIKLSHYIKVYYIYQISISL